jgi:hypothetical protein
MRRGGWLESLRQALFGDLAYKAVAFAFALVAWLWVQNEQVVEDTARARIVWTFPDGLMPVEPPLESTSLTLEGIQSFVRAARQQELTIAVDLARAREGDVSVELADRPVAALPSQVRVASVAPSTLKLTLDRILKRRVPVVAATRGEVAAGHRLAGITISPDRVELSGPASVLRALAEATSDAVDLAGLTEDASFEVGLALRAGQLTPTGPTAFTVAVDIEPIVVERTFAAAPVALREGVPGSPSVTAVSVVLEGPEAVLAGMAEDAVRAWIDAPVGSEPRLARFGASEGARLTIEQPGGDTVRVVRVEPAEVALERK